MRRGRVLALAAAGLALLASSATGAPSPTRVQFTAAGDFGMVPSTTGAVLNAMKASGADLAVTLGDLSYGTTGNEQAWCDFVTSRMGAGYPFELLSGNHESNGVNGNINDFAACLPNQVPGVVGTYGRQYYMDVPQDDPLVRFVMISPHLTYPDGMWSYSAGSPRYLWTAHAIDEARAAGIPWVVVGMHKVCLSVGSYPCEVGADLANLLVAKRVDLVMSGHEHIYARSKQLAHSAQCPSLRIGGYDPSCVQDSDDDLKAGAGTVFMVIGTGGIPQREVNATDPERDYFVTSNGAGANLTYGAGGFDVTPDRLSYQYLRAAGGTFSDAFTLTRDTNPPENQAPMAAFVSTSTDRTLDVDATSSTDVDGSIVSYAWQFGDGTTGTGVRASHAYAAAGSYDVTLTVTDDDGATGTVTRRVTVSDPPSASSVAADAFERAVVRGWGAADQGGQWTASAATGVHSVSNGRARTVMTAPAQGPVSMLGAVSARDVDITVDYGVDKLPAGSGARIDHTIFLRRTSSADYRAMVRVLGTGSLRADFVRVVNGTPTTLGAQISVPGLTIGAGDRVAMRAQVVGTTTTQLRLKVWRLGTPEPSGWTLERSDSTAPVQQSGAIGFQSYLSGSATNAPIEGSHDNLAATLLP